MTKKSRNILIVLGALVLVFVSILGYGAYTVYKTLSYFSLSREVPPELKEPRITVGSEAFSKDQIFSHTSENFLKVISDASKVRDEKDRQKIIQSQIARSIYNFSDLKVVGDEIVAVGEFGAYILNLSGELKRAIAFEPYVETTKIGPYEHKSYQGGLSNILVVQLEKNKIGFLSYGSREGVRVFDDNGDQIWSMNADILDASVLFKSKEEQEADLEKSSYVLEAAVGDLDGDGISEFIVASKKDGIRAYDRSGVQKWFVPDDFPMDELTIRDIDGDGKTEVIAAGKNIRDANGKFLREFSRDEPLLFADDKSRKTTIQSVNISRGVLSLMNDDGTEAFSANAPLSYIKKEDEMKEIPGYPEFSYVDDSESVQDEKAVWVQLHKDKPRYLAVVAPFILLERANLYIFESNGKLVYHELFDEDAETVAVLPTDGGNEQLVVGGKSSIWKYAAK